MSHPDVELLEERKLRADEPLPEDAYLNEKQTAARMSLFLIIEFVNC
jgi:hypothetical protein